MVRPAWRPKDSASCDLTMSLVKAYYADFEPTLATAKLKEKHACSISRETLRKWMIEDGLQIDGKHRVPSVHQTRNWRERTGELVQIDGSRHYWFENRAPESTLIAYIDDANSRILHAAFVASEPTLDYLCETKAYIERHGRPNVPQAEGQIERVNGTLEDRLVEEMRMVGNFTIEAMRGDIE
jgi:hypothetical protein